MRRIFFADLGDFDSLDKRAAPCGEAGVTCWRLPDPIDTEFLERESEFAQVAAVHANLVGAESDAKSFAVSLALKVREGEVAVWQDEESAALQIDAQGLRLRIVFPSDEAGLRWRSRIPGILGIRWLPLFHDAIASRCSTG